MKHLTSVGTDARPSTDCQQASFQFQDLGDRKVLVDFSAGRLSSDGGALFLRQVDAGLGLTRTLAGCFSDQRDQRFVDHTMPQLLAQRIYGLALGYEDLNDHEQLRRDPLLATACDQRDPLGVERFNPEFRGIPLAAPSTLNRLAGELRVSAARSAADVGLSRHGAGTGDRRDHPVEIVESGRAGDGQRAPGIYPTQQRLSAAGPVSALSRPVDAAGDDRRIVARTPDRQNRRAPRAGSAERRRAPQKNEVLASAKRLRRAKDEKPAGPPSFPYPLPEKTEKPLRL